MLSNTIIIALHIYSVLSIKPKAPLSDKTTAEIKKILEEHEHILAKVNKTKTDSAIKFTYYEKPKFVPLAFDNDAEPKILPASLIQGWAQEISDTLYIMERKVVRREELLKGFSDVKMEERDGTAIVNKMADVFEDLLQRRARAAEDIMHKAEELTKHLDLSEYPSESFTFDSSVDLDRLKEPPSTYNPMSFPYVELPLTCMNFNKMKLRPSKHFDANVSLDTTSVHVSAEVFACDPRVKQHLDWSTKLYSTFRKNYVQDATMHYQYFCSAKGFLRHYPATSWESMFNLPYDKETDIYDCRLRPWYVSAGGAPRDVLILVDASGSMTNSSNLFISEQFTLALLSALTDDDHVNVLRFNVKVKSPIKCFEDKLVPANHVNSAAMMAAMYPYAYRNTTHMADVLQYSVRLLQKQRNTPSHPPACQQAIVILSDSIYENFTELMRKLDPHNRIRLFILWLHDPNGIRDNTRAYADYMTCDRDGYFAELITHADVTEQVLRILRVLERPLIAQRTQRFRVYSDMYAHLEDPRRGEQRWRDKESAEQRHRYRQLRRNKQHLLSAAQRYRDHMHQESLDKYGYYYEDPTINYNMQISVSVSVFEHTTVENITIELDEEKKRNSTRTYPVNRLLGVAGVDIPIDHLKLLLPYHQLGGGGTLFILDQRGNIVLHDNMKSTFDGDILRPGYRTVDFLDLEQPATDHYPRQYPADWLRFRNMVLIGKNKGNITMYGKNIFESGLRAIFEMRDYHWRRVLNHYTAVVVIPPYNRHHIVPETAFSKKAAEDALKTLSRTEFSIHPDWLYCRHVERHFDTREAEVLHFIRRRSDEPKFDMKRLRHDFYPSPPTLFEKPYQCDKELMAKLCKEAVATERWARDHDAPQTDGDCSTCRLGPATAFFASESGLTRWHQYPSTSQHAAPPAASLWARGPAEAWYKRAVAQPDTLLVHAPVAPLTLMRNTFQPPPPLGPKHEWLTAARTLGTDKGFVGVAGYHFHPQHFNDVLTTITAQDFSCTEEEASACPPRCAGRWRCVLVDDGAWIVATQQHNHSAPTESSGVREHLSSYHGAALRALVNASVFARRRVHDYQAVCFFPPPLNHNAAPHMMPSLVRSLWYSTALVFGAMQHTVGILYVLISTSTMAHAETRKDKEKRQRRLRKDYARERYEELFDPGVLINRTVFAACDRYRDLYQLQRNPAAMEWLSRPPSVEQLTSCSKPVHGAPVPGTNLLLLALYACDDARDPPPSPLHNNMYPKLESEKAGQKSSRASQVACHRNRVPLLTRPPATRCFPHDYTHEEGYRQCGPWLPDPEKSASNSNIHYNRIYMLLALLYVIYHYSLCA